MTIRMEAKSVKFLTDRGVKKLPREFILPELERPKTINTTQLQLPVVDISRLDGPFRSQVVCEIGEACHKWGFFQVVNHGVSNDLVTEMMEVTSDFFQLPEEERKKYMVDDMTSPVRYGTSMNQNKDRIHCWRDFLKQYCSPLEEMLPLWPSSPSNYRSVSKDYAQATKTLGVRIFEAVVESLGVSEEMERKAAEEFRDGSHMMVLNYYPACPEPELTYGIPPHTDYGCITILSQDSVGGLQLLHEGQWVDVNPLRGSFVINIGDHIEIMSNGKYRSVTHRAITNSKVERLSVASLFSVPLQSEIAPLIDMVDNLHPPSYRRTNFEEYINFIAAREYKARAFLDSVKVQQTSTTT